MRRSVVSRWISDVLRLTTTRPIYVMKSTSRYYRLILLTGCIVANLLVSLYAVPALLALTGLGAANSDGKPSDDRRPRSSSTAVSSHVLMTADDGRTGRRWKSDELAYGYVQEPPDAADGRYCDRLSPSNQTLLILVCSAVENIDRRKAIRSTWGDAARLTAVGARLVFVVARTDPARSPPGIERRVAAEHRRRGDVVQADVVDDYVNLTAKTAAALRWAARACPRVRHVMKSDDDVYVDVPALTRRLEREREAQRSTFGVDDASAGAFIVGQVVDSARPVRDRRSKWYTPTSIYPDEFYPPYTSGTGYVLGAPVVRRLVALIDSRSDIPRPFWLEDVYITGMLAAGLPDVRLVHDARFNFRPTLRASGRRRRAGGSVGGRTTHDEDEEACVYRDAITVHDLTPTELISLWRRLRLFRSLASHCTGVDLELMDSGSDD